MGVLAYGLGDERAVEAIPVDQSGPAAKAGLREGDLIGVANDLGGDKRG